MTGPVPCAGAIIFDGHGRLLLVRRLREPGVGLWTIPGGRCQPGEPPAEACLREVAEETGLLVDIVRWVGTVERPGPTGATAYLIDDFLCTVTGGTLQAGDDAAEARWCPVDQLDSVDLVPQLRTTLSGWGLLG